jgi:low temperature requirement protein LtrA
MFQIQQGAGRFPRCLSIGAGAPATGAPFQWVSRGANALTLNPVATPDGQGVTWVELFFDLIFVFSVTQLVGLLHDGFTWLAVGQVALAFWFVWFAWGQFTWALNAANTHHNTVQRFTLGAAAVAFAMAVSIPDAFHDRAFLFAITYVGVRLMGISIFLVASWHDPIQKKAVIRFASFSLPGLVLVIVGGVLEGDGQYWAWGGAIAIDLVAATLATDAGGFNINREHFSERHGLFVIIALGESLIIAAAGVAGREWTAKLTLFALTSLAFTFGLWWTYFAGTKDKLDSLFESLSESAVANVARDSFSMIHYPMLVGIIFVGAVIEEGIVHPEVPFHIEARIALGVGIALFVVGMGLALKRAGGDWHVPRMIVTGITAVAIVFIADAHAYVTLVIGLAGLIAIGTVEHFLYEGDSSAAEDERVFEISG